MTKTPKKILICPLNWGLGHASRSIPIISYFLNKKNKVFIASDGQALQLLKREFPALPSFELPGYDVTYHSGNMALNIVAQLPKIFLAYRKEKKAVQKLVKEHGIEIIISDNRYGCRSSDCLNIVICHQIQIQSRFKLLKKLSTKINLYYLNKFDSCWIPDTDQNQFAGALSSHKGLKNYQYIGPQSRLKHSVFSYKYELVAILSGPEPERTKFERKIIRDLQGLPFKCVIVRGTSQKREHSKIFQNIDFYDLLSGFELNTIISRTKYVLLRSGYSSIMDLYKLRKKAILIPTKGQTEQEYLAKYVRSEGIYYSTSEDKLDVLKAISEAENYPGFSDIVVEETDFEELLIMQYLL